MNALELMRLYVATANRFEPGGRMVETNDGLGTPAPRLFFGRTAEGNCWYFGRDLGSDVVDTLGALLVAEPVGERLLDPAACETGLLKILNTHASENFVESRVESGPFYWFRDPVVPVGASLELDADKTEKLTDELESWRSAVPYYRPFVVSLEGDSAAAVCASVRSTETAYVAGCETESRYRRRGHAASAVSGWAKAVQERDAIAFYNTDWENIASQRTAVAAGAVIFGVALVVF